MRYRTAKIWTILNGAVMIPLGTLIGFMFGTENYPMAFVLLVAQVILVVVDGLVWFKALELMPKNGRRCKSNRVPRSKR